MDARKAFYSLLNKVRLQLQTEHAVKEIQYYLLTCSGFTFCLFIMARFFVIIDTNVYIMVFVSISAIFFFIKFWVTRPDFKRAAYIYDQYCGENRTTTALSFIEKEETVYTLQRKEALFHMKKVEAHVSKRNKKYVAPFSLGLSLFFIAMTSVMIFLPNEKMAEAEQLKKEKAIVQETKKELEKLVKKKTDPIIKKAIETALDELKDIKQANEALKKLNKQSNELMLQKTHADENKTALNRVIKKLESGNFNELAKALQEQNKEMLEKGIQKLQEQLSQLNYEQKELLSQLIQSQSNQLSSEDIHSLQKQLTALMEKASQSSHLADSQKIMQRASETLVERMLTNNIQPSTKIAQSQGNNSNGNTTTNNPQHQQNGQQNGSSSVNGSQGQGQSQGQGGSGGNGNGGNSGSNGNGNGNSNSGAGFGMGSRTLTIPETLDGKINIEKDKGKMGEGKPAEQGEGKGPVLKGTIRPYEEVYNQYEKSSRESTNRLQLPSELESIVKNYFSKIKPDRE
ncbi:hypothetical protein KHA93_03825 [Bacillus sp. FJAT-49732]|uniref:Uncharacterized protein n=1 Tax=Lederbergia citrisecunda TaxID=2833583 RepID=A0A942TMV2_9BACI|nr:hypothetical protein [Lederbergia citrisecunda]MBS4198779.1 hypothetical protein [Lederbergia citrisecunda]